MYGTERCVVPTLNSPSTQGVVMRSSQHSAQKSDLAKFAQKQAAFAEKSAEVYAHVSGLTYKNFLVYINPVGERRYYNTRRQVFVPFESGYCVVTGETRFGRQVHENVTTGIRGIFHPKTNEFRSFESPTLVLKMAGEFQRPNGVVHAPSKPTGHQAPKVKENGGGKKKKK